MKKFFAGGIAVAAAYAGVNMYRAVQPLQVSVGVEDLHQDGFWLPIDMAPAEYFTDPVNNDRSACVVVVRDNWDGTTIEEELPLTADRRQTTEAAERLASALLSKQPRWRQDVVYRKTHERINCLFD